MGIKGLDNVLRENCSKGIKPSTLHEIRNKKVCVDISEFIYKSIRKNKNAYVSGILNLIELFSNWEIKPIIIFDGKSSPAKNKVNQNRCLKREKAHQRKISLTHQLDFANEMTISLENDTQVEGTDNSSNSSSNSSSNRESDTELSRSSSCISLTSLSNFDNLNLDLDFDLEDKEKLKEHLKTITNKLTKEVNKADGKSQGISSKKISEIKELLDLLGIPYIHNINYEADIICSHLVSHNIVDYCISNDMDMLTFGCNKVIRNLSFTNDLIDIYYLDNILQDLEVSYSQFIDICILMGCDYTSKMYNIKSKHPLPFIKKYQNIEKIINNLETINTTLEKKIIYNDNFKYPIARNIFNMKIDEKEWKQIADEINFLKMEDTKLELNNNNNKYNTLFKFCEEKCDTLNNTLITNKINAFLGKTFRNFETYGKKYNTKYILRNVSLPSDWKNNNLPYIIKNMEFNDEFDKNSNNKYSKNNNNYSKNKYHNPNNYHSNYVNDIKNDIKTKSHNSCTIKHHSITGKRNDARNREIKVNGNF